MSTRITRILILDDHAIVRRGLRLLLEGEADFQVCAEAGTISEALDALERERPDLALVDITLRDEDGLDFVREARRRGHTLPVLVLSMHGESTHAAKALRAGAQGYVMKEMGDQALLEALRVVRDGREYFSPTARQAIHEAAARRERPATGILSLTERELEIFECIGRGMTSRRIAEKLGLSERTVEVHRAHIKQKLGCEDAAQVFREAVKWVESLGG